MNAQEMAGLIDRLGGGSMNERIAANNIRQAGQRGFNFVMSTTERQRDPWFPMRFASRLHQELAARASVITSCELQLICEVHAGRVKPNEHA